MKYTNIKKLLIKFMGGGLINFPTRFLRWIKIDGDAEGSDGGSGGDSSSDVFFVPATIQPKYFINDAGTEPIDIKNYTLTEVTVFLYNKEDIISLGVNEEDLNNLGYIGIDDSFNDVNSNNGANGYQISKSVFDGKIILYNIVNNKGFSVTICNTDSVLYKISDNVFFIIPGPDDTIDGPIVNPGGPIY